MPLFVPQCTRTVLTHVGVGMGAASFWRGAWYLLDDHLFPDNAQKSAAASLVLGVLGMSASQGLMHKCELLAKRKYSSPTALRVARFGALYTVAMSCVLVWRGTWMGWDCLYERLHPHNNNNSSHSEGQVTLVVRSTDRGHATHSGLISHAVALTLLLGTGLFASVLAPPAAVSVLRDWAVRTSPAGSSVYQGPAQVLAQRLFGGGSSATRAGASAAAVSSSSSSTAVQSASAAVRGLSTRAKSLHPKPVPVRIGEREKRIDFSSSSSANLLGRAVFTTASYS